MPITEADRNELAWGAVAGVTAFFGLWWPSIVWPEPKPLPIAMQDPTRREARRAAAAAPPVLGDDPPTPPSPAAAIYTAYQGYPHMTPALANAIVAAATELGANPYDLAAVLRNESQFNPRAQSVPGTLLEEKPRPGTTVVQRRYAYNPSGRATGILQWIDPSAELGVSRSTLWGIDAVAQMDFVKSYFADKGDLSTKQGLFLAVFYPDFMTASPTQLFPADVRSENPGLNTPQDYVARVDRYRLLDSNGQRTAVRSTLGTYLPHPDERATLTAQRTVPLEPKAESLQPKAENAMVGRATSLLDGLIVRG